MTPNEMTKSQLLALVKVLRSYAGEYGQHKTECAFLNGGGGCSCGFSVSMREVSDAIEGKCGPLVCDNPNAPRAAAAKG